MTNRITKETIIDVLKNVEDPELHKDLVTLGMIKNIVLDSNDVTVTVELTTPACPLKNKIQSDVENALKQMDGIGKIKVEMDARVRADKKIQKKNNLEIKNIIAVASGKGGVGKSTIAVNLAMAFAETGAKVGLMDADIYGPNVPTMMGVEKLPQPKNKKIIPAESHNVKVMSIGFLVKEGQPLIWRGPLLHGTIRQFIEDVEWGELDYLIVDLPPGTGDVQLSLSQHIPITCGVIITMPQKVSVEDASRGVEMFNKLEVPIAGVIENMSGLELQDGSVLDVFGSGGGEEMANHYGLPFLGRIPLDPQIRLNGDSGSPIVLSKDNPKIRNIFIDIVCKIAAYISQKNLSE